MNIDALCVPAHKGLLGPQGCGAVILGDGVRLETLIEGGNGVDSLLGEMPAEPPERYEAGTLPIPAIIGLSEGIDRIGLDNIERREKRLFKRARNSLSEIDRVRIYCPEESGSVVLFSVAEEDSERRKHNGAVFSFFILFRKTCREDFPVVSAARKLTVDIGNSDIRAH